jgi:putative ABC transport system permease protein
VRLLVAIAGIAFSCFLIFMQLGFLESLFDGATRPHKLLDADVVLVNPRQQTFFSAKSFPRQRLYQAAGYEGVESIGAVNLGTLQWRNPETKELRAILVFGVQADGKHPTFNIVEVKQHLGDLKGFNHVLFDRASRPEYGPMPEVLGKVGPVDVEVNSKKVTVTALYEIGASFTADGSIITSDTTFTRLFDRKSADDIEIGLIKVRSDKDVLPVQIALRNAFGNEVGVYTRAEFAELEKGYWANNTGIGFVFGLGVVVGFIVGVVVVYQILHSDVADHLPEYATLKAIGYTDNYLLEVLVKEALILATIGYVPGLLISVGVYHLAQSVTLLPLYMTWERAAFVFVMALAMCSTSATVAIRKLRSADPADVF